MGDAVLFGNVVNVLPVVGELGFATGVDCLDKVFLHKGWVVVA